ncbi:MAG: hypothetical protein JXA64_09810 [Candidatus Fermentibacteraceae bacterium]|nr:hypothetical protein [Candidatus Fermentibacteraceae bacterium]MBN2609394.1 hypothetical protein [Candidatus Fermentibacteraceae bacterium]
MSVRTAVFSAAVLLVLTGMAVLYIPCLRLGFLGDDFLDLDHGFGPSTFGSFEAGGFRPLIVAVWTFDSTIYGPTNAWGWHLTNILLHLCNIALVLLLLRQFGTDRRVLLAALAFFAFSFSVVPSVCRVSGRTTVAALVPLLGAMNLHVLWKRKGNELFLVASLLLVLASLLTKETALACPIMFGAVSTFLYNEEKSALRVFSRDFLIYMLPVLVYALWRLAAVGSRMGYAESGSFGVFMIRNLALLGTQVFSPWLSGLSARMALLVLPVGAWLLRGKDGLGLLGLVLMLGMLVTVSNLPPRPYYAYAAIPGATLLFAALARACSGKSRLMAAVPVLLLLGSFLEARDEAGRLSQASEYTETLIGHLAELEERTPGEGPLIVSGYRSQVAGYGTLWPGAYSEALGTRGLVPGRPIRFLDGYFFTVLLESMECESGVTSYFAEYTGNGWETAAFRPGDRKWDESGATLASEAGSGSVAISDSLWMRNSCFIVTSSPCSLGVIDPMADSLVVYRGAHFSGDTTWFDLENSRAWLISNPPFSLFVLSSPGMEPGEVYFSPRRIWLPVIEERLRLKDSQISRQDL